jgi:hypothetical protein
MNVKLRMEKNGTCLFEGTYDINDSESFGQACADVWTQIRTSRLGKATSVGALMEMLNQNVLEEIVGAKISVSKA